MSFQQQVFQAKSTRMHPTSKFLHYIQHHIRWNISITNGEQGLNAEARRGEIAKSKAET